MTIGEMAIHLEADILAGEKMLYTPLTHACGADLMSDVLAFAKSDAVLLTGLVNVQVIRTAEMMDMKAVVFVRGKKPTHDMIELANEKDMVLLSTKYPMFESCGILYSNGLQGGIDSENII